MFRPLLLLLALVFLSGCLTTTRPIFTKTTATKYPDEIGVVSGYGEARLRGIFTLNKTNDGSGWTITNHSGDTMGEARLIALGEDKRTADLAQLRIGPDGSQTYLYLGFEDFGHVASLTQFNVPNAVAAVNAKLPRAWRDGSVRPTRDQFKQVWTQRSKVPFEAAYAVWVLGSGTNGVMRTRGRLLTLLPGLRAFPDEHTVAEIQLFDLSKPRHVQLFKIQSAAFLQEEKENAASPEERAAAKAAEAEATAKRQALAQQRLKAKREAEIARNKAEWQRKYDEAARKSKEKLRRKIGDPADRCLATRREARFHKIIVRNTCSYRIRVQHCEVSKTREAGAVLNLLLGGPKNDRVQRETCKSVYLNPRAQYDFIFVLDILDTTVPGIYRLQSPASYRLDAFRPVE